MINLEFLNKEQKETVKYIDGPSIIIAGAGSGKTRVLTYKIAYLIEKKYEPDSILALTFTNKAANEMKQRIKSLIGDKAEKLWIGTFHSIFAKILRMEAKYINYTPNFSIYDVEDSEALVTNIITEFNYSMDTYNPNLIRHRISNLKNRMIFPVEFRKKYASTNMDEKFAKIYEEYQKRLVKDNSMDFEDLLLKPIELFENNPKVLLKYKKMFQFILVDEFQDTNKAQYVILKTLLNREKKICVVGDDAQSIYSWRGADLTNMLYFQEDFPNAKVFKLEQNYRSTKNIIAATESLIKKNKNQLEKKLWTDNEEGDILDFFKSSDEKDEAVQISKLIKEEIKTSKRSFKEFAVLYRTNYQSRALEEIFRFEKIPYIVIGGVEFYKRKEVKDILAYLKLIANPMDEVSLLRIINFPQRGIGVTTIDRMIAFTRKLDISLYETTGRIFEVIDIKERIQKNVKHFRSLIDKYIELKKQLSPSELTRALIDDLGIIRLFKEEDTIDSINRLENINELLNTITEFSQKNPNATLDNFLEEVSLITDIDMVDDEKNAVSLLTVHSAKGLEYPVVFVSGLEEDIFPLSNKFSPDANIEEERRLFYVAMTRAKEKVYLSYSRSRYRFGEVAYQSKSRFLNEIDADKIIEIDGHLGRKSGRKSKREIYYDYFKGIDFVEFNDGMKNLKVGSRVMHEKFGLGKVSQIIGAGDNQKAIINFEGNNIKQLMLKFTKLKILI
ncbi:MAG: 3'-5' exonuclease [Ignavibacterium sp.]